MQTSVGEQWAKENNNMMFFETSAIEGTQVNIAFEEMAKKALEREANN